MNDLHESSLLLFSDLTPLNISTVGVQTADDSGASQSSKSFAGAKDSETKPREDDKSDLDVLNLNAGGSGSDNNPDEKKDSEPKRKELP